MLADYYVIVVVVKALDNTQFILVFHSDVDFAEMFLVFLLCNVEIDNTICVLTDGFIFALVILNPFVVLLFSYVSNCLLLVHLFESYLLLFYSGLRS